MVLPPVAVDGAEGAAAGPNVKTAEAPAASVSIFLRVTPSGCCMSMTSADGRRAPLAIDYTLAAIQRSRVHPRAINAVH
ncbi:hypothetical protein ACX3YC_16455 [Pseudomonas mohnii]